MSVTGSASSTNNLNCLKGKIASLAPYAVDPTLSVEGAVAEAKAVGDALEKKLDNTDVVDNLTTSDSKKVLSAKQGNVLKKSVDDLRVNTEESIGNMEQTLLNMGVTLENAQNSAENAATNADNALSTAEKKIDPDGTMAMAADFDMGGHGIVNLNEPIEETDAANKKFVEDSVKLKTVPATLKAADWYSTTDKPPYMQEITVEGLTDGVKAKVWAVFEGDSDKDKPKMNACGYVDTAIRGEGEIIFTCFDKRPDVDIVVMVELYHGENADGECIPMIGFNSGLKMVLLWENASPASSFAELDIAVDLSKYTKCCIEYNGDITDPNFRTEIFPIGNTVWLHSEYNNRSGREVVISKESVAFSVGKFGAYNELMRENNGSCVPLKIYGIRGVL